MTEQPRAFEADTYTLPKLELKTRPSKDAGQLPGAQERAGLEQTQSIPKAVALSREVIVRLIDWFQAE
ncbi:MAG: hypothetical protein JXA78_04670 [Anaerolineales bacterium]|nr:hypothetical protein [Anaerolineales bacterium]